MLEHHPLVKEFPEHAEIIHNLKETDNHFNKLFDEYEALDKEIFRIEANQ
ncbi:YdcH family protein [Cysteiniphilum sp. 6C5]